MENNALKERVRKNVKEKIALLNIKKEADMERKSEKIVYLLASCAAIFILVFGLIIGVNTSKQKETHLMANTKKQTSEETIRELTVLITKSDIKDSEMLMELVTSFIENKQ